ncbi:flagellar biosynthesis protein FlhB [Oryzibacter oryziterrae]|uniref:flagellar biosynthesis protein FlhB n=1 Tax=Oryzibacter oryziterrae TaxID=2766474 RepID=UPI001F01D239|nr:flagellar biosynthesis protein FlhB [Oryzibacter oryziterrae]
MAEEGDDSDKTEEPTQRRLQQAHEQGDVVRSLEVSTFFTLAGVAVVVGMVGQGTIHSMFAPLRGLIEHAADLSMDGGGLRRLYLAIGGAIGIGIAIPLAVMAVVAIAGHLVQHRMVFSADSLIPRLSKVSPLAGFKRLFSVDSLINFLRGMLKVAVLGAVMTYVLWPERNRLDQLITIDISQMLSVAQAVSMKMLYAMLAIMFLIAVLDYAWARWRWMQRHRMSLQEVKDEHKQIEGDPTVKGKLKALRMERARNRMMANVPKATVVVTNPTHYAVALKYDEGMQAPVCVAKGVDEVALRIREIAKGADVPVVENPPLARTLYASVELDQMVPAQHYKAVAQLIGYVLNLKKKAAWRN